MAAAVEVGMSTNENNATHDYHRLCDELEKQELEAPGGVAGTKIYLKLLVIYLLKNDMCNAKYLWKRIPQSVKTSTPELALVWNVGQKMWQRDFPAIYLSLRQEWTENISPLMQALADYVRLRAVHLVSRAYSSISADEFASFVGMTTEQAVEAAVQHGWQVDVESKMILPKKPEQQLTSGIPNEEQLSKLTEFVSFLEIVDYFK